MKPVAWAGGDLQVARRVVTHSRTARPPGSNLPAVWRAGLEHAPLDPAEALPASRTTGYPSRQRLLTHPHLRRRAVASSTRAAAAAPRCGRFPRPSGETPAIGGADAVDVGRGERLELLAQVGRGVDEKPRAVSPRIASEDCVRGAHAHRRARPRTSRSGSSTGETLRRRPSRGRERAWAKGTRPRSSTGGHAGSSPTGDR